MSFTIYGLLSDKQQSKFDNVAKTDPVMVEKGMRFRQNIIDWRSNREVRREMRRDIKRVLRDKGAYRQKELDDLTRQIVEVARRRADG